MYCWAQPPDALKLNGTILEELTDVRQHARTWLAVLSYEFLFPFPPAYVVMYIL
jgi:hypothetical protein